MMPAIQAHFAPVKNPAPSARPRIPKMMTTYASAMGPEAIPDRTEAPPKSESKPPAAATIDIATTPAGRLGFEDCITPVSLVHVISLMVSHGCTHIYRSELGARMSDMAGADD